MTTTNGSAQPRAATGRLTVNPGDTIVSTWGNTTFDQTVEVFDTAAQRDAQWATPHDGAACYTLDTQTAWLRRSGAWVQWFPPVVNRYGCRALRSAAFTTPSTAGTAFLMICDSAPVNQGTPYNTATGLYTCPAAGLYLAQGGVGFNLSAAGNAQVIIQKNAANVRNVVLQTFGAGYLEGQAMFLDSCAAGDTFALNGATSLASQTLRTGNETYFHAVCLGPP